MNESSVNSLRGPTVYTDTVTRRITIDWPDPKPDAFIIDSKLFEQIMAEINAHRALVHTLEQALRAAHPPTDTGGLVWMK